MSLRNLVVKTRFNGDNYGLNKGNKVSGSNRMGRRAGKGYLEILSKMK